MCTFISFVKCIMSICSFGYFPFWFRGRDFGSDCTSSCSLLACFTSHNLARSDKMRAYLDANWYELRYAKHLHISQMKMRFIQFQNFDNHYYCFK